MARRTASITESGRSPSRGELSESATRCGRGLWRDAARLPTLFLDAVNTLQPGALSSLLRSANGFHILKLNERRGSTAPVIVRQTRARHILIRTNELVPEAEARRRLVSIKERLENKADFASWPPVFRGRSNAKAAIGIAVSGNRAGIRARQILTLTIWRAGPSPSDGTDQSAGTPQRGHFTRAPAAGCP